ncbi:hypothetical protein GGR50DRAFT_653003 [Xylaria sp. CBS 124048]|nr:hypothetical protein GGR50DRAFT_653003 [Xylaria sp. CBS 124048]
MATIENIARPVGIHSKYHTARHSLGILRAVIVTCRYRTSAIYLRQKSLSLQDVIENALTTVILGQPMLRLGIAGEDTKDPTFVHLKTIDMRRMIEWQELITPDTRQTENTSSKDGSKKDVDRKHEEARYEADLFRSLEKHHRLLWEDLTVKPGWKIVVHHDPRQLNPFQPPGPPGLEREEKGPTDVLLSFDIAFCFHHAYADGRSGYIFHKNLQQALNNATRPPELQNHIFHLPKSPTVPPNMETLIPFSTSWSFMIRAVWEHLLYPTIASSFLKHLFNLTNVTDTTWTGAPVDASNTMVHIRMLFQLEGEARLNKILAVCRSHGTSLTGLLHALIGRALARREGNRSFRSVTPIALSSYVDRSIAGAAFTPGTTIHCLVTALTCDHDLDSVQRLGDGGTGTWAFAKNMTARLRAKAASLPRDDILALSPLVGDWHEHFRGKFGKARESSWELSNLGSLSAVDAGVPNSTTGSGDGRWFIDRALFTQGAKATGAALNVSVSGVVGRGVWATVSWQDGIVSIDLAEAIASDVQAWIDELGETGRLED